MASGGIGFGKSSSKSSGRQGSGVEFPKQFISDLHDTLGGPFTVNDLMRFMPRATSLFGYGPKQQWEPDGRFNLGFGPPEGGPPEGDAGLGSTPPPAPPPAPAAPPPGVVGQVQRRHNKRPDTLEEMAADRAVRTNTPYVAPGTNADGTPAQTYTMADLENAYFNDPDKVMDIPRLFEEAGLDPNGFTYDQFEQAVGNAKKLGFSGRSRGAMMRALSGLQRDEGLEDTFGATGGKGTGVF